MMDLFCCFCNVLIRDGFGNNPEPLASHPDRCCDSCNSTKVVPARIERIQRDGRW